MGNGHNEALSSIDDAIHKYEAERRHRRVVISTADRLVREADEALEVSQEKVVRRILDNVATEIAIEFPGAVLFEVGMSRQTSQRRPPSKFVRNIWFSRRRAANPDDEFLSQLKSLLNMSPLPIEGEFRVTERHSKRAEDRARRMRARQELGTLLDVGFRQ